MAHTGGYTLVEAIVTLAVVALILIPLGRIFLTAQSAANDNTARQQGLGLDTAVLAKIGVARYGVVGLTRADQTAANGADPGYTQAAPGGASLVTLAGTSDLDGAFRFGPNAQIFNVVMPVVAWGDRSFKVVTWVTAADAYVPACPTNAGQPATSKVPGVERKVTVSASWFSQLSGWITATESTIVYPGGLVPYQGTETRPPVPGNPTATPTETTGRVDVSWVASGSGCYSVSWVTPDQAVHSTALLAENDPGYLAPPPVGGSGTATYAVDGLPEDQTLIFFVTAYTPDGTVSSVSADTGHAVPASGPLVTQVTATTCPSGVSPPCPYGGQGSSIRVTGTGFAGGAAMTLVQAGLSQSIGACTSSPCTLSLSGLPPLSNTWSVVATAGGISSPPLIPSDFSFNPAITAVNPTIGTSGTTVTVTGTNFVSGTTFTYTYPISGVNQPPYTFPTAVCSPAQSSTVGATSCKLVMPASIRVALLANGQGSTNGAFSATSTPGGTSPPSSDAFTYTAT